MTQSDTGLDVARFAERFFRESGADFEWLDGILSVSFDPELAEKIDGPRSRLTNLNLAFAESDLEKHPDAELLVPGSFRLDRMIQCSLEQGRVTRQFLVWEGPTNSLPRIVMDRAPWSNREFALRESTSKYVPFLLYTFGLSRIGLKRTEEVFDVGVSLVTGAVSNSLLKRTKPFHRIPNKPEGAAVMKRRISYRRSLELATSLIRELAQKGDTSWAKKAIDELGKEREKLEKHFSSYAKENPEVDPKIVERQKNTRIKELHLRLHPRIIVRPAAAALLFIPCVEYKIRLLPEARDIRVLYNPVLDDIVHQ